MQKRHVPRAAPREQKTFVVNGTTLKCERDDAKLYTFFMLRRDRVRLPSGETLDTKLTEKVYMWFPLEVILSEDGTSVTIPYGYAHKRGLV